MAGYILRGGQQNISLPAEALDKLLQSGQGDAALLYLALQRFGRGVTPEELEKALRNLLRYGDHVVPPLTIFTAQGTSSSSTSRGMSSSV